MNAGTGPDCHDHQVGFLDDVVPGDRIDIAQWKWWSHAEGGLEHYYARGPCPGCGAPGQQGHTVDTPAPLEGQGGGAETRRIGETTDAIEVPVQCWCGDNHGREGATGCGRRWSIIGPRAAGTS
jgi:hypothetical protein